MSKSLKTFLTTSVSLLLAGLFIWLAFKGIDFQLLLQSFEEANWWWILLSVSLGIYAYWLRSERWKLLLEPINPNVTSKQSFIAVCMNYFWNLLIPRSGEVARCTSLYSTSKTPVNKSFGTVITERIIDLLFFGIFFLIALILNVGLIKNLFQNIPFFNNSFEFQYYWIIIILLILLFSYFFIKKLKTLSFYPIIVEKVKGFIFGIRTIQKLKNKRKFVLYSVLIWVAYFLMTYVAVFALPVTEDVSIADGFFIFFVGAIGMMIPASGGIGAYHAAMRLAFITLGFSAQTGVAIGFLIHTPHTMVALVLGVISLIMNINSNKVMK